MDAPGEVLNIVLGVVLGFLCATVDGTKARRLLWLAGSIAGGALVSWSNGEFPFAPEFLLFDVPLVGGTALAVSLTARWLRRTSVLF